MPTDALFAGYATRVAFNINLSKTQIQYLHHVAFLERTGEWPMDTRAGNVAEPNVFVPSSRSLIEKGLVEHNPKQSSAYLSHLHPVDRMRARARDPDAQWSYRLTEAGRHVHALLVLAGLVPEPHPPVKKTAARKRRQDA